MLKENEMITIGDVESEIVRISRWIETCRYASCVKEVYAIWGTGSTFNELKLIFETENMTTEKFAKLRELVDFELQKEIPLEVYFGNHDMFPSAKQIYKADMRTQQR